MGTRGLFSPEKELYLAKTWSPIWHLSSSSFWLQFSTQPPQLRWVHHLHLLLLLLLLQGPSVIFQWRMLITLVRPVSVGIVLTDQPVLRSTADADQPGIILRQRSSVKKSVRVILSFYMQIYLLRTEATFC